MGSIMVKKASFYQVNQRFSLETIFYKHFRHACSRNPYPTYEYLHQVKITPIDLCSATFPLR